MILDRIQDLAIRHKAKIWSEADLLEAVGEEAQRTLNDAQAQRELFLRDVALWRGFDKKFRIIDQQPPDSKAQAKSFVQTRSDGRVCSFCRLADEPIEFVGLGPYFIHPQCRRAWFRWVRAAIRDNLDQSAHWSEVLGIDRRTAGAAEIKAAYKRAAQKAHPDKGGSATAMQQLNQARNEALASPQAAT